MIVDIDSSENDDTETINQSPSIVASGYNEVPEGSYKCAFHPDYEMCYRDFLQEEHAKKIKYCPNCGTKIEIVSECIKCKKTYPGYMKFCRSCRTEINPSFNCKNGDCRQEIYDTFLPGSKNSPGKLLDLCRSLHAEENALLKLLSNNSDSNNLTLYVTTQPCNMCANKIVSSGIKRVVFSEPYSMREAMEILKSAKIELVRFQGVKSSAYFGLYK